MKEEARSHGGSHVMDTNDKRTVKAMSESHKEYRKRLDEERLEAEEEARKKAELEKEQIEQQKKQEAISKSDLLDKLSNCKKTEK